MQYDQVSLLYDIEQQHKRQLDIVKKKNSDYAQRNPFENFEVTAYIAGMDVPSSFVFHMANKLVRIKNLLTKENDVVGESIEDSLVDLANYANLMLAYYEQTKHRQDYTEVATATGAERGTSR